MSAQAHVYPPPAAAVRNAWVSGMDAYRKLCDEAERDYEGFWARLARETHRAGTQPFTTDARRIERAVLQVVRGRHAQRVVQLPRPQRRSGHGDKTAIIFEADDGSVTRRHLPRAARARLPLRQRAEGARRQEGRPRRHLHADVGRRRRRDAGLRAHRRASHSVVFGGFSAQSLREPHRRRRRRRSSSPPTSSMRGGKPLPLKAIVDEALALGGCDVGQRRHRLQAHRRQGRRGRRPRHLAARARREGAAETCEPEWVERRAPAVHPLHLGLDRQAQGRAALAPAATCCARR